MKKLFLVFSISCVNFLFAANSGNVAEKIRSEAEKGLESITGSIAGIINTITLTIGIVWIIVMILMAVFSLERLKEHSKLAMGGIAIIGIVYSISASYMS
ncbi:hypothetical protein [Campylobacter sp. MIT 97-5078]|uniref:hypothetical protein n=1 Tax=Campylobacter sp. MIT 97-5078 TaxID=1548153 RepID=UPI0012E0C159|nr:hypothetical protein [Campylobacter sp. MIT 97-5078]